LFNDAVGRLGGAGAIDWSQFNGTLGENNEKMLALIQALQGESQAQRSLDRAQEDNIKAQNSLAVAADEISKYLPDIRESSLGVITAIQSLVEKTWNVGVTVNRDTGAVAVSNAYAR
jgi:hypothetical protein